VSVIGDWNGWRPEAAPLVERGASGIREGFLPGPGSMGSPPGGNLLPLGLSEIGAYVDIGRLCGLSSTRCRGSRAGFRRDGSAGHNSRHSFARSWCRRRRCVYDASKVSARIIDLMLERRGTNDTHPQRPAPSMVQRPRHRLARRRRSVDSLAGHARPHGHACGDRRGRAVACRVRGLGPAVARSTAPRRTVGRRRRHAVWWSNLYTLLFLRDLGIDPASAPARTAIDRVPRGAPGTTTRPSSRGRSSSASTAAWSCSARTSASAAIDSSINC
jgi:hypothetical protein